MKTSATCSAPNTVVPVSSGISILNGEQFSAHDEEHAVEG